MATIEWRGKNKDIAYLSTKGYRQSLGKITKEQAEQARRDFVNHANRSHTYFPLFCKEYLVWHESEYPDSHYRIKQIVEQHLMPFFTLPIEDMTEIHTEEYKAVRGALGAATGTIIKELRTYMAILNRAVKWRRIARNPITDLTYPKQLNSRPIHFYSKAELQDLYKASPEHKWIWQFLANTGLRRSEFLNLEDRNIRPDSLVIESTAANRTKSGKFRIVPLSEGAREAMGYNYRYTGRKQSLSRAFSHCSNRAGLGGSLHSLRHTFAAHLVMNHIPLRTVQVLMGHSSIAVTERYAHLAPDYLARTVQGMRL